MQFKVIVGFSLCIHNSFYVYIQLYSTIKRHNRSIKTLVTCTFQSKTKKFLKNSRKLLLYILKCVKLINSLKKLPKTVENELINILPRTKRICKEAYCTFVSRVWARFLLEKFPKQNNYGGEHTNE